MKRALWFALLAVVFLILSAHPGCKKWEGRYYISSAAASTMYFADTDESLFSVGIEVANSERAGVGAVFVDWDFEVCEDEDLILKINKANYDSLDFIMTIYSESPIPDSSTYSSQGFLNVLTGRAKDTWKVPGDVFNGKTPNKLKYSVIIVDDNGYTTVFSGELGISHLAY
ncbi:MAG: hypothetical protein KAW12_18085 [Candidatus Aminicenantes bacterium]|nr:hypothetical protein [Candidatus Aminicenantes bacterium]